MTELSDDLARALSPETSWPAVIVYGEEGPDEGPGIWLPEVDDPEDVDGDGELDVTNTGENLPSVAICLPNIDDVETEPRTARQVSP